MLISKITAWITVFFAAVSAFKYIARKSGNKKLNRLFHRIHIPAGWCFLCFGLLHGLLAGNIADSSLREISIGTVLFTFNWGTVCLICAALLALTYLLRRKLKKHWMPLHRALTVLLITLLVLHITNVGIHLFDGLKRTAANTPPTTSALEEGASEKTTESTTTYEADPTIAANLFSGAVLKDGTYTGAGKGYGGTTTVKVTVSGGAVTKISVVSENDSPQYFSRAESLIDSIINKQTLKVDAVSGATYSSAGLVAAITDALQGAVSSGTLQTTSYNTSSSFRPDR